MALLLAGNTYVWAQQGQPAAIDGEVRILHIDRFERGKSETVHMLHDRATGKVFELKFERRAPRGLKTGDRVAVRGNAFGRAIWVDEITAGLEQEGTAEIADPGTTVAQAAGERRAVVLVLNMSTSPGYYTQSTVDTAEAEMFTQSDSVNSLFDEGSFGQLTFPANGQGAVYGPLEIPYFSGCPYYSIADAADQAAADAGIDLSGVNHKIYLVPPSSISDCSWLALGEVGNYGASGPYRSWSTANNAVAFAHELGHNLGWHHAATDADNDGTLDVEYGDTSDLMGYCCSTRKFNSAHMDQIGWFDSLPGTTVTVITDGLYDIATLGSDPGSIDPQVLKIDRPNSNDSYYLSYRQATGLDSGLHSLFTQGVNIHHASENGIWSYFIESLTDGGVFTDAANGISVTQIGQGAGYVTVDVSFDNCVVAAPTVALGPPSQMVSTPSTVTYQATVTNNDSLGCGSASFSLVEDLDSLGGSLSVSSVNLGPSESGNATLTVSAEGPDDTYSLSVAAVDMSGSRNDGSGGASLQIDTTPPQAPAGAAAAKKKVKGQQSVRVTWEAASDVTPGTGVAGYRVYRSDLSGMLAETSSLSYSDSSASTDSVYTYNITAVDNAGHESALSTDALYDPSSGGGGKGGGKGGKGKPSS